MSKITKYRYLKLILFLIFSLSIADSIAQAIRNKPLNDKELKRVNEILKNCFKPDLNFNFDYSTFDFLSLSELKKKGEKNSNFDSLNKLIQEKPEDVYALMAMANYYEAHNIPVEAFYFYSLALENIKQEQFVNYPARYFSLRAFLKFKTNGANISQDYAHALTLDPQDSIAINYYPLYLIQTGETEQCKIILNKTAALNKSYYINQFLYTGMIEFLEFFKSFQNDTAFTQKQNDSLFNLDADEILKSKESDLIIAQNKKAKLIPELQGLRDFSKIYLISGLRASQKNISGFDLTKNEKKQLKNIYKKLKKSFEKGQINEICFENLSGFYHFLNGDNSEAKSSFKRGLDYFPQIGKIAEYPSQRLYENYLSLLIHNKDYDSLISTIEKMKIIENRNINLTELHCLTFYYFENLDSLNYYTELIFDLEKSSFNTNSLYAHINFINKSRKTSEYYLNEAEKYINNEGTLKSYFKQVICYQLINQYFDVAHSNFEKFKKFDISKTDEDFEELRKMLYE